MPQFVKNECTTTHLQSIMADFWISFQRAVITHYLVLWVTSCICSDWLWSPVLISENIAIAYRSQEVPTVI